MPDFSRLLRYKLRQISQQLKITFPEVDSQHLDNYALGLSLAVANYLDIAVLANINREFFKCLNSMLYINISIAYNEFAPEYFQGDLSSSMKIRELKEAHMKSYKDILDICEEEWLSCVPRTIPQDNIVQLIGTLKEKLLANNSISMDSASEYSTDHNEKLRLMVIIERVLSNMSSKIRELNFSNIYASAVITCKSSEKETLDNVLLNAILVANRVLEYLEESIINSYGYSMVLDALSHYFLQFVIIVYQDNESIELGFKQRCLDEYARIFLTTDPLLWRDMPLPPHLTSNSAETTPNTTPNPGIRKLQG